MSILSAQDLVRKGALFKIGDDLSINPWIPLVHGGVPKLKNGIDGRFWSYIAQLWKDDRSNWNVELLEEM